MDKQQRENLVRLIRHLTGQACHQAKIEYDVWEGNPRIRAHARYRRQSIIARRNQIVGKLRDHGLDFEGKERTA